MTSSASDDRAEPPAAETSTPDEADTVRVEWVISDPRDPATLGWHRC